VVLAIWLVCRAGKLSFIRVCDYIAPCAPMGLFFGRLANFINGELWGREAGPDVRWAMVFPDGGPFARHPSQLYEAALEGLVLGALLFILFWRSSARWRPGLLMGIFGGGYGVARFIVEYYREPDEQLREFAAQTHMSMGQWLCVPMIALGAFLIIRSFTRPMLGASVPVHVPPENA
jgi:phosphatidylglycerol:prolipoprotein diacylglycerol transferase